MHHLFLFWIIAGLFVLYHINVSEVITAISIESSMIDFEDKEDIDEEENYNSPSEKTETESSVFLAFILFIMVVLWPIVWIEYRTKD